jgi:hypothetical protein
VLVNSTRRTGREGTERWYRACLRSLVRIPADFLIVTALLDLYFDEDVREREAAFAFERALLR